MRSNTSYDLIVVGAGIMGASVAWHAMQAGLRTLILDAAGPAAGASGASDGAVSVATKKPGMMTSLACEALRYAKELSAPGGVLNRCFSNRPSYIFATHPREISAIDSLVETLSQPGLPVTAKADTTGASAGLKGLGRAVQRVIQLEGEGHMTGYGATVAFVRASKADTRWPCQVDAFETSDKGIAVSTSLGIFSASRLLIANGLGACELVPDLPILPRSGQLIVTDRNTPAAFTAPQGIMTSAVYLLDKTSRLSLTGLPAPVVIDPLATGQLLIGSSREEGGHPSKTDFRTVRRILQSAVTCLPAVSGLRIIRVFAGVRAACQDGMPIVGPLRDFPNVSVAAGFEGDGICLAPLIGREFVRTLTGESPQVRLDALSPDRFNDRRASVG